VAPTNVDLVGGGAQKRIRNILIATMRGANLMGSAF
jgi:hypothetical protein